MFSLPDRPCRNHSTTTLASRFDQVIRNSNKLFADKRNGEDKGWFGGDNGKYCEQISNFDMAMDISLWSINDFHFRELLLKSWGKHRRKYKLILILKAIVWKNLGYLNSFYYNFLRKGFN